MFEEDLINKKIVFNGVVTTAGFAYQAALNVAFQSLDRRAFDTLDTPVTPQSLSEKAYLDPGLTPPQIVSAAMQKAGISGPTQIRPLINAEVNRLKESYEENWQSYWEQKGETFDF